jgi:hypothetical protein
MKNNVKKNPLSIALARISLTMALEKKNLKDLVCENQGKDDRIKDLEE